MFYEVILSMDADIFQGLTSNPKEVMEDALKEKFAKTEK